MYGLVVLFLAATGLRAAELAGLEIRDIDLTKRTVKVERTKRKIRGGWETGTPKSRKSRRVVPLDGWLVEDLRAYLATHPRRGSRRRRCSPPATAGTRQACRAALSTTGRCRSSPGTFYANYLKPALTAVGLPASAPGVRGVRLHDLRHTYAVLPVRRGALHAGVLTTAQAAEHLGISRGTLARYARDGLLKPTLKLPTGHLRWSLVDLRRQMRELREGDR